MESPTESMNCYKCKHPNLHGSNFCEKCGADLKAPPPKVIPVRPYQSYPGGYSSGPADYAPPSYRPSAPKPTPAPRPMPAGSSPPASATPPPPSRPAAPPAPPKERRRDPVISRADDPPRVTSSPRREPLPFARLSAATGQEFLLRYDSNLVGRASPGEGINPQVDLSNIDARGTISRKHARVGKDDSAYFVEDLGSSNGTRLNGQALRAGMQSPLNSGDQLIFGDIVFTFHLISK